MSDSHGTGKNVSWRERLTSFLHRRDRGDVIVGDVGQEARGVVVGKNVIQIGTLVVPARLVVAVVAAFVGLVALSAFLAWSQVPDKMTGLFNIAVADFGEVDASGQVRPSPRGQAISQRLFKGLQIEFDNLPAKVRQDLQPQIWHDSLALTQKRATIGFIPGDTPQERARAVADKAKQINAHIVIYGNLPGSTSDAGFVPEIYVAPGAGLGVEADKTAGFYNPPGDIPVQLFDKASDPIASRSITIRLNSWTSSISLFTIGLMYDLLGYPGRALPVLQQAADEMTSTGGEGSEVLWYFIGRQNLWLRRDDEAQPAFELALRVKPDYARARLGLGDVFLGKAERQPSAERLNSPDLDRAIAEYEQALETIEPSLRVEALYALGGAFRLKGETHLNVGDYAAADAAFITATEYLSATIPALIREEKYRMLAQTYATLGIAYEEQGHSQIRQGNKEASRPLLEKARETYDLCIQQQAAAPTDSILADQVIKRLCIPYKKFVEDTLSGL